MKKTKPERISNSKESKWLSYQFGLTEQKYEAEKSRIREQIAKEKEEQLFRKLTATQYNFLWDFYFEGCVERTTATMEVFFNNFLTALEMLSDAYECGKIKEYDRKLAERILKAFS